MKDLASALVKLMSVKEIAIVLSATVSSDNRDELTVAESQAAMELFEALCAVADPASEELARDGNCIVIESV